MKEELFDLEEIRQVCVQALNGNEETRHILNDNPVVINKVLKVLGEALIKNRFDIHNRVEREWYREDVLNRLSDMRNQEFTGDIKTLDMLVDDWQDSIDNCDSYWETNWMLLDEVLDSAKYEDVIKDIEE